MDILRFFSILVEKSTSGKICIIAPRVYLTEEEFDLWYTQVKENLKANSIEK